MPSQFYADVSTLSPPLTVDGVEVGLVVRFNSRPYSDEGGASAIVSGTFAETPTGSTTKTIVCSRAFQSTSRFRSRLEGGPRQEIIAVEMGGNIAETPEPARSFDFSNGRAFRGSDAFDRAMPGDVLRWQGRAFLILSATPFASAPSVVAWQGSTALPRVSYVDVDFQRLALEVPAPGGFWNRDAALYFPDPSTGIFGDAGVFVEHSATPSSFTLLERVVFDNPETSAPDAAYYPPAASFSTSVPQFWLDESDGRLRIGSHVGTIGDRLLALYYHRQLDEIADNPTTTVAVLEGAGAGYGSTSDDVALVGRATSTDFDEAPFVFPTASGAFLGGALEWRRDSSPDAPLVAIRWNSTGVASVVTRSSYGGALSSVSFTPAAHGGGLYFAPRIKKTADTFVVYHAQEGAGFVELATVVVPGLVASSSGVLSIVAAAGEAVKFLNLGDATLRLGGLAAGVLSSQLFADWPGTLFSETYGLDGSTAITAVENMTPPGDPVAMSVGTPARRDRYTIAGSVATFTSETAGDRIRITNAAVAGTPATPGDAPHAAGTVNFATGGSTIVGENRGNWRDVLTVADPHDELEAVAGEAFDVTRDPVFSPNDPPTLSWALEGDPGADWSELDAGDFVARWVEGIVLISTAFLAGLPAGAKPCFRAAGSKFSQSGNCRARQVNDLAAAFDSLDELYLSASALGFSPAGVSGSILPYHGDAQASGFGSTNCFDKIVTGWYPAGATKRSEFRGEIDDLLAHGVSPPYWFIVPGGTPMIRSFHFGDPMGFSSPALEAPIYFCPGTPGSNFYTLGDLGTPIVGVTVNPFGTSGTPHFGATLSLEGPGTAIIMQPSFSFDGLALGTFGPLSRMPEGTVCLEARMPVRFTGLESTTWSKFEQATFVPGSGAPASAFEGKVVVNGVTVSHFKVDDVAGVTINISNPFPAPDVAGELGLTLVGRRLNSRNVTLLLNGGEEVPVPDGRVTSYGAGVQIGGAVSAGLWSIIDATSICNALLAARSSQDTQFELWPSAAGVDLGTSADGLAAYALGLLPAYSVSGTYNGGGEWTRTINASGSFVRWSALEGKPILGRFRLPAGEEIRRVVPFNRPARVAAE